MGSHSLYVKFIPSSTETNYDIGKITTGKVVVLTVVEGDPQEIDFAASGPINKTYGDGSFTNAATNSSSGGGTITYTSSNIAVAEVDSNSGEITIKGTGNATITATAAEVEGKYRETSKEYILTVGKKAITVSVNSTARKFGEANPTFTIADPSGVLTSGDNESDLSITLSTLATSTSDVGDYDINGTSASANYTVTITPGTLAVNKADAPTLNSISKSLFYDEAHTAVSVNVTGLPAGKGNTIFTAGAPTGNTAILNGAVANTATGIQFSSNMGTVGQTVTIPVTVTMQNYENAMVNVIVTLVDKTPVTVTGVTVEGKTYDGTPAVYTGTPANAQGYTGVYEYIWSVSAGSVLIAAPKDAGSYVLTVKVPDDNTDYMGEVEIPFTIEKKTLTAKPQNLSIYNGGTLPVSFTLEYVGIVSGDTITPSGTPEFALKNGVDTLVNSSANGTYTIEWTNKEAVTIGHSNYTITKADGTLTISSQPSSGGKGSGGGGAAVPTTPTEPKTASNDGTATVSATVTATNSGSTASAAVNAETVTGLVTKAKEAETQNKNAVIEINVNTGSSATAAEVQIPKASFNSIVKDTNAEVKVSTGLGSITFDEGALTAINSGGAGDISIRMETVGSGSLSDEAKALVGDRPVYDFTVSAGDNKISSFNGGTATVSIPYTLRAGEDQNAVVVYYMADDGTLQTVRGAYNAKTGTVEFAVSHFSKYAVGYNKISFTDVSNSAWYKDAVTFLSARGITAGTSANTFSPNAAITRGEFLVMLMRAYGIEPTKNSTDNFADAGNAYYKDYLATAKKMGITQGTGNNQYQPNAQISRQDMFTMLYRALEVLGEVPKSKTTATSAQFTDSTAIAGYAKTSVDTLVSAGIISGSNGKLDPSGKSTRAQMAQILQNLLSE